MSTTTIRPTEPPAPATAPTGEPPRATRARLAGASFVGAATVILMGIVTAEALYPATYTTFENEISDLGATRPPNSVILQPSATIFDVTMIVAGLAILAGAWLLWRQVARRGPVIALGVLGFGVLGVGVFPGNTGAIHQILSLVAFGAGGVRGAPGRADRYGPLPLDHARGGRDLARRAALVPRAGGRAPDGRPRRRGRGALDRVSDRALDRDARRMADGGATGARASVAARPTRCNRGPAGAPPSRRPRCR